MADDDFRTERDSMGEVRVPADAYFGAATGRALLNFPISGRRMPPRFIRAVARIKWAAARVNRDLGRLDPDRADAIERAAREVVDGLHDREFVVDVFQTGSGTSTNMNVNEVVANRAAELLGATRGARDVVHPNDHVNLGQSSNDVIPTALHLAALEAIGDVLVPALTCLLGALEDRAAAFRDVLKPGRTHLQDATPIRLGQVFDGYSGQIERSLGRADNAAGELREVALGGTAVGTGLNTYPEFAGRVCRVLREDTGIEVRETGNHFLAQATLDAVVSASGSIRTIALSLMRIADDIRWLASGPRAGIGELEIPAVQPGSSIMPGKVNPVIAESLIQVCAQVCAGDAAIAQAAQWGQFELNTMLPLATDNFVPSIEILGAAASNFAERSVVGLQATDRGPRTVALGLGIATGLVPRIGYDLAARVAHAAADGGGTVRDAARALTDLDDAEIDALLDPETMTRPRI